MSPVQSVTYVPVHSGTEEIDRPSVNFRLRVELRYGHILFRPFIQTAGGYKASAFCEWVPPHSAIHQPMTLGVDRGELSELILGLCEPRNDPPTHINYLSLTCLIITPDDRLKRIGRDVVVWRRVDAIPSSFDVEVFGHLLLVE